MTVYTFSILPLQTNDIRKILNKFKLKPASYKFETFEAGFLGINQLQFSCDVRHLSLHFISLTCPFRISSENSDPIQTERGKYCCRVNL